MFHFEYGYCRHPADVVQLVHKGNHCRQIYQTEHTTFGEQHKWLTPKAIR